MKIITKEMRKILADAVEECGSQMEFQRRTGIRQSTINKILNGKSQSVADRTWRDILSHINGNISNTSGIVNTGISNNITQKNFEFDKQNFINSLSSKILNDKELMSFFIFSNLEL